MCRWCRSGVRKGREGTCLTKASHRLYLVYEAVQQFAAKLEIASCTDQVLHLPLPFVAHRQDCWALRRIHSVKIKLKVVTTNFNVKEFSLVQISGNCKASRIQGFFFFFSILCISVSPIPWNLACALLVTMVTNSTKWRDKGASDFLHREMRNN